MKTFLFFIAGLLSLSLFAQQPVPNTTSEKGAAGARSLTGTHVTGTTYAVVVGISDYQDPGIPDLRFADRDALAFAGFLQSPAGGSLDEDHLKVLINEQATAGQVISSLYWLLEASQEGDRVIIYFSGHGDVENVIRGNPGHLLCWDAPSRVYMAGGTLQLINLQSIISTISIDKKAKVYMVADACRSGKLSGSGVGGPKATTANLSQQYANEIKILSCQPDEYSIEGEQWGGGRGVFSYHLLDGLFGMADRNGDASVNLMEIRSYLEEHVSMEVDPQSQLPMTIGNGKEKITDVFPDILEQLKEGKRGKMQLFTPTESRGIEDDVLATADSNIVEMYLAFKQSLKDKQFLEPASACAEYYYKKLSMEPQLKKLHSSMRRNYAAALQDDAQQVLNTMLKSGLTEIILKNAKPEDVYKEYPEYLEKAAALLGEKHYLYPTLQARKHFFEAAMQKESTDKIALYRKALNWQPDMVHAMVNLIRNFKAEQQDSAEYYFHKATKLVPSWVEPYLSMQVFYKTQKRPDKEEEMLKLAGQVDSVSVLIQYQKASFYLWDKKYNLAEKWFLKTIAGSGDICFPCAHNDLGLVYMFTDRYDLAEAQFKKAIQLDSTMDEAYNALGTIFKETGRFAEAEQHYKKAFRLDTTNWQAYANLGVFYHRMGRWKEATVMTQRAIEINPDDGGLWAELGHAFAHIPGRKGEALPILQKALKMNPDWPDTYLYLAVHQFKNGDASGIWLLIKKAFQKGAGKEGMLGKESLKNRRDFSPFRKDPRWQQLMDQYFPDSLNTND